MNKKQFLELKEGVELKLKNDFDGSDSIITVYDSWRETWEGVNKYVVESECGRVFRFLAA